VREGKQITLGALAEAIGGEPEGDLNLVLSGASGLEDAQPGVLVRVEHPKFLEAALACPAAAFLTTRDLKAPGKPLVRVKEVKLAFARCLELFYPEERPQPGIHPTAVVDETASVGEGATIGAYTVVGKHARIGSGAVLHPHVVIGDYAQIGEECVIFPQVVIYDQVVVGARSRIHSGAIIGADGFGFVWDGRRHYKVPQVATVQIGSDVEIGANTCIDRGTTSDTVIGSGTKMDNQVQVGHNVATGPDCLLIAQVGIGGSTTLGRGVVLAGKVGVADHVRIGDGVVAGALTGIWRDTPAGARISGNPARPHRDMLRIWHATPRLPELLRRVGALERRLGIHEPASDPEEDVPGESG
jgi:UDP-3-O-[3-hydroxymyristoyl] glucosamine N-acyltransferase